MTDSIDRAAATLRAGGLVAFPTETVYGLGADASNPAALRRLYAVKGRPLDHPVIVHLGDPELLDGWGRDVSDDARLLALACWPGPLTIVVARDARVPGEATGGRDTVGLRVPDQPLALELLRAFDGGIAAPSANRFGLVSPTTADHVRADLGADVDVVLDGGPCTVGVESTIVDCSGSSVRILRPGAVTPGRVSEIIGREVAVAADGAGPRAPGRLVAHYQTRARVVVIGHTEDVPATARELLAEGAGVGLLAMPPGPSDLPEGIALVGSPADVAAYARGLYGWLRAADELGLDALVVAAPPETGLGVAVADRLRRAAAR